jgi:hypothetical protein
MRLLGLSVGAGVKDSWRSYVLAELRCARARARLCVAAIEEIGKMLQANMITADEAIQHLWEAQALDFLHPEPEPLPTEEMISGNEAATASLSHPG